MTECARKTLQFSRLSRKKILADFNGGPEWDAYLGIEQQDGHWVGWCDFITNKSTPKRDSVALEGLNVAVGSVVEIGLNIDNFAPTEAAKPIWTLYLKARTVESGKMYYPRTRQLPVFNESAAPGVATAPYVRNLMYLAADVGLEKDDRIACAIAITATTITATSDVNVRRQLRQDNAELLRFAREIVAFQRDSNADFRLDRYPLEAQVAWANRCIWLGVKYLRWHRTRDARNDLENYRWAYTSIETLRKLRQAAEQEGLLATDAGETARRINRWVAGKLNRRSWIGHVERDLKRFKDDPEQVTRLHEQYQELRTLRESGRVTVGQFRSEPVYQVFARNTGIYLRLIQKEGCFWGGCPDEAWIGQDLLRAAGLAPLALSVHASRGHETGHCWAGYYNPVTQRWHSAQDGRSGETWWWFQADRVAVYPHAAMATRVREDGPLPFPWFLKRELQGEQIKELTQGGIPTQDIRRWMFTPCW